MYSNVWDVRGVPKMQLVLVLFVRCAKKFSLINTVSVGMAAFLTLLIKAESKTQHHLPPLLLSTLENKTVF